MAIERHGEEPGVLGFASKNKELEHLRASILAFAQSGHRTLGIICKTRKQAEQLHKAIHDEEHKVHLLSAGSAAFFQGVVICTAHLAKGLEFDQVIVPYSTDENYGSAMDKNLLYVACTRAMHKLTLTYVGKMTRFIQP